MAKQHSVYCDCAPCWGRVETPSPHVMARRKHHANGTAPAAPLPPVDHSDLVRLADHFNTNR